MARTTLLLFFCIISLQITAQNLTGRWIGSFIANEDAFINNYAYQIEIKENSSHQISAQTITQKGDRFYVSAFARGSHSSKTNLVQIFETSFDQIKMADQLQACLMTNFLTYKVIDGHEILEGKYMSTSIDGKINCGSGKLFLEKNESLLSIKKNNIEKKVKAEIQFTKIDTKNSTTTPSNKRLVSTITKPSKPIYKPTSGTKITPINNGNKIASNLNIIAEKQVGKVPSNPTSELDTDEVIVENENNVTHSAVQNSINNKPINLPWVLVGRENKLVKKIITNSKNISIDLFDNGTIDNDTIIVYDNKKLLINKKRLSYKSIHLEFEFSENMRAHEIIIVAHNMGTVPPNTALLLYKDGKHRQEYFITSTNKINAKLLIVYEPLKSD